MAGRLKNMAAGAVVAASVISGDGSAEAKPDQEDSLRQAYAGIAESIAQLRHPRILDTLADKLCPHGHPLAGLSEAFTAASMSIPKGGWQKDPASHLEYVIGKLIENLQQTASASPGYNEKLWQSQGWTDPSMPLEERFKKAGSQLQAICDGGPERLQHALDRVLAAINPTMTVWDLKKMGRDGDIAGHVKNGTVPLPAGP